MFSELDCLGSEIAEMAERLKPVLAPEGPEADGGKPQEAAGSFVMGQIRLASSVIADKRYRLRSLCRRVEL